MVNDYKNSFNSILNERLTSPFYGTLIISWLIWNWRIIYLTIFVSEKNIKEDKISYIMENFSDIEHILIYPLISTVLLILIIPFITNGAYWVSLLFNQWKTNKRNEVQKKELLTLEQSISLREQIKFQEKRFEDLLEDKNLRIKQLETQIQSLKDSSDSPEDNGEKILEDIQPIKFEDSKNLSELIRNDPKLKEGFQKISFMIQRRLRLRDISEPPNTEMVNFFLSNDMIEGNEEGKYDFTKFGKNVARLIYDWER